MCENWNCNGSGPHTKGEVRVYPIGGGGNLILCESCFRRENEYNRERYIESGQSRDNWPLVQWITAKRYPEE